MENLDLDNLETKIMTLKKQLDKLLHKNNSINTIEIIKISEELDEVLYLYHKIKSTDIKKDQDK
ncbi:Spo0E family sporulation regulatory protein-aspartic acid phosphatase [Senegalia massiliensis]|uniref:Spo0E family sporulation regulatory protein-aspartic acid phosphatase n=1 Tax=Senegalia massiliensis TaxID=1720316 RepID=UPI0013EF052A|nr:Spo0E family sporulation regulatory protein-aspartic acid phosphatase [Senegalia massiliensis]